MGSKQSNGKKRTSHISFIIRLALSGRGHIPYSGRSKPVNMTPFISAECFCRSAGGCYAHTHSRQITEVTEVKESAILTPLLHKHGVGSRDKNRSHHGNRTATSCSHVIKTTLL